MTAQGWPVRIGEDRTQFLKNVIERVIIHQDHIDICLRVPALVNEILGGGLPSPDLPQIASIECPFSHIRQGRAVRLIVGDANITTDASRQAILKAIARARRWYERITTGEADSIEQLAGMHAISARFIRMQMKLVLLSPRSIESMMNRTEALPLSLDDLLTSVPKNWREQIFGHSAKAA